MNKFDEADYFGQKKILPTLKQMFSGCTLQIDQHFDDKNSVDIYITATTKNNKEVWYAIECKDRKMTHNKYKDEGYIIEDWKVKELLNASSKGYRPIYLNSFSDDYIVVWNLNNIDFSKCGETGEKQFHRTTVMKNDFDLYSKNKITLKNSQAECIIKMIA